MHVKQFGSTLFVTNPNGWDMSEGELTLSLREARTLREALDPALTERETEGVEHNGEDG